MPIYSIVDYDGNTVPTGYEEVNSYSTTEVKTGDTWINGKPIYRKVVNTGQLSSANKNVAHNIENINEITKIEGLIYTNNEWFTLPRTVPTSLNNQVGISANKTNIILVVGSQANFADSNVVLEYTKTTD